MTYKKGNPGFRVQGTLTEFIFLAVRLFSLGPKTINSDQFSIINSNIKNQN
jgi:hypothetical protein